MAHAIAHEAGIRFQNINATEVVSGVSGMNLIAFVNCVEIMYLRSLNYSVSYRSVLSKSQSNLAQ